MDINDARQNFLLEINQPDHAINLAKAALYLAQSEYPELEPHPYLQVLDSIALAVKKRLQRNSYPLKIIKTINEYLFDDLGYRGNQSNYYDPRNSFLNEVLDRRIGIPITLSLVYLEIARRLDFPMVGIGMPAHFLIRPEFQDVGIFIDPFNRGEILFAQDCQQKLREIFQQNISLQENYLIPVTNQQFLTRMLTNIKYIYVNNRQLAKALTTVDFILQLAPDNPREVRDRGLIYYDLGQASEACQDLELYLTMLPNAQDEQMIRSLIRTIK